MKIEDIRKGDIVTYQDGKTNNVNKPYKYRLYFTEDFINEILNLEIVKIQRYKKVLWFYILKTIYKRR